MIHLLFDLLKKLILFATLIPVVPPQMALPLANYFKFVTGSCRSYLPPKSLMSYHLGHLAMPNIVHRVKMIMIELKPCVISFYERSQECQSPK